MVTSGAKTLSSDTRVIPAIQYATEASIYPPEITAAELTTAQTLIISFLYALKHRDVQLIKTLLEVSSTVPQIKSSFLSVWLRDDFCFPRGDIAICLSTLGKLLIDGLQFPWTVAATLASLDVKYRIQECFAEADDTAGQILLSTMNTSVSEGTQVDIPKILLSKESQTTLMKHVSFQLPVKKTSTGTQAGLLVHDRGISVKPEQSTKGVQTTPSMVTTMNSTMLSGSQHIYTLPKSMVTTMNSTMLSGSQHIYTLPKSMVTTMNSTMVSGSQHIYSLPKFLLQSLNDSGLGAKSEILIPAVVPVRKRITPLIIIDPSSGRNIIEDYLSEKTLIGKKESPDTPKTVSSSDSAHSTSFLDESMVTKLNSSTATGSHTISTLPKPSNDPLLRAGNGNGLQTSSNSTGIQTISGNMVTSLKAPTATGSHSVHNSPKSLNDSGLGAKSEILIPAVVPVRKRKTPLSIIDPSSGRNMIEDYLSEKTLIGKKESPDTPNTVSSSDSAHSTSFLDEAVTASSSSTTEQSARVKDETKNLGDRTEPVFCKDQQISKERAKELLYSAIQKDDTKSMNTAISAGADVNDEGVMKKRPLHVAASAGRIEAAIELIHCGADVDPIDSWGETPLFVACVTGHLLMAEVLVAAGARPDHRNLEGNSPLHAASSAGQLEVARLLLSGGAEVDCRGRALRTPLHCAAAGGHLSVVGLLLDRGADPMAVDVAGHTPLSLANSNQQHLVAEFLYYRSRR